MKAWHIGAAAILVGVISAEVSIYREQHRNVPAYAGSWCDKVWRQTRATEPTIAWYRACIKQVAEELEKASAAQRIEARSDETLQAAQPERREPGPKDAPGKDPR